jgi:organic radical activating enzyme
MLKSIEQYFDRLFSPIKPIPAGVYQYQAPEGARLPYKLHLRVETDGTGILILNASTVLHLNQTAAEYIYHLMKDKPVDEIVPLISERYDVGFEQSRKDLDDLLTQVDALVNAVDLDPVAFLNLDRVEPYSKRISAPYRLDCALTYRVPEGSDAAYAPTDRVKRELSTDEWKTILRKAWEAGVPHVNFTGGEPTLRDDLPELVLEAENLGMVCGLLTDGSGFRQKKDISPLLANGLDHIMLLGNPGRDAFWKALKLLMPEDIAVTVHVTITIANQTEIPAMLESLAKEKVTSLSLSAVDEFLAEDMENASRKAASLGISLVWDLPVPYSDSNPVALETRHINGKIAQGVSNACLYVEPDGDVLPAQGINKVLGNLLTDPWTRIWKRH